MSGETEASPSSWNPDLLKHYVDKQIEDLKELLQERYETQQTAMQTASASADKAVDKALDAAEKAVDKQTIQLDKEFHEHLEQVRHENALAFLNADKANHAAFEASDRAISKAETANEKRFESVNEFRGQLNDQARSFLPRTEYDANHTALIDKVDDEAKRNGERFIEINRRLDLTQGSRAGTAQMWAIIGSGVGLFLAILGIVAFFNSR